MIRDHDHFESINDFVAFYRHKVKDFTWHHSLTHSWVDLEFYQLTDALLFKLKHG